MRFAQLVIGPAGSGKSTYCATIEKFCEDSRRTCKVVNLDPAAESFSYNPIIGPWGLRHLCFLSIMYQPHIQYRSVVGSTAQVVLARARKCAASLPITNKKFISISFGSYPEDGSITDHVRELIQLDDALEDEDLNYGPNGGLVFCLEYLTENLSWLTEQLGDDNDDYFLFDCPGQIELYTHLDVMPRLVSHLRQLDFNICSVFLVDSQFMVEPGKFVSGVMSALSAMVTLETPHLNVLSKMDLLTKHTRKQLERFLDPDLELLLQDEQSTCKWGKKYSKLNAAICGLIENFSLVKFLPLNIKDQESVEELLLTIDNAIQYGEDLDVKMKYPDEVDDDMDDT